MNGMGRRTHRWLPDAVRLALYQRDGFRCVYCGCGAESGRVLSLDHVLPRQLGGTDAVTNLVTACVSCNSAKRDLSLRAWLSFLRDRGVDTTGLARRIRAALARRVDRAAGRRLAAQRAEVR